LAFQIKILVGGNLYKFLFLPVPEQWNPPIETSNYRLIFFKIRQTQCSKRCFLSCFLEQMLIKLTPVVNFTNILQTAFAPIFFQQKIALPNWNQFTWTCTGPWITNSSVMWPANPKELPTPEIKAAKAYFCTKKLLVKCRWYWHLESIL
jgi:hypothetical protein